MARRKKPSEAIEQLIETEPKRKFGLSDKFVKKNILVGRHNRKRVNLSRPRVLRWETYTKIFGVWHSLVKDFLQRTYAKLLTFSDFSFIMKIVNKVNKRSINSMPNSKTSTEETSGSSSKKHSKNTLKWYQHSIMRGIIGIVVALVTVSVAYSVGRVYLGDEDPISRLMITPAALAVLTVLGVAFWKIFK